MCCQKLLYSKLVAAPADINQARWTRASTAIRTSTLHRRTTSQPPIQFQYLCSRTTLQHSRQLLFSHLLYRQTRISKSVQETSGIRRQTINQNLVHQA